MATIFMLVHAFKGNVVKMIFTEMLFIFIVQCIQVGIDFSRSNELHL